MSNSKKKGSPHNTRSKSSPSSTPNQAETSHLLQGDISDFLTQDYLCQQLSNLKSEINKALEIQKNEIIEHLKNENTLLKAEITELKENINEKEIKIVNIERDVINLQQYIRRNNIEFCGISDNINGNKLQQKVIEIAEAINVKIDPNEIEACHRLPKGKKDKTARTIVRFVNRKLCDSLHLNKKKLKEVDLNILGIHNSIYINCNLCPYNKFLWGKCKQLHSSKLIDRFWIYNGNLFIACDENGYGKKIQHFIDLQKEFPGYDFSSKIQA